MFLLHLFKSDFVDKITTNYSSKFYDYPLSKIVKEMNNWVDRKTKGMIKNTLKTVITFGRMLKLINYKGPISLAT